LKKSDEEMSSICLSIKEHISNLPSENPFNPFEQWTATDKHKSKLIHILVNKKMPKTIRELAPFLDFNAARSTDQCTPLHLSAWTKNPETIELLVELGGDPTLKNKYGENTEELVKVQQQVRPLYASLPVCLPRSFSPLATTLFPPPPPLLPYSSLPPLLSSPTPQLLNSSTTPCLCPSVSASLYLSLYSSLSLPLCLLPSSSEGNYRLPT
jgi:hypothetical protein